MDPLVIEWVPILTVAVVDPRQDLCDVTKELDHVA